MSTTMQFHWQLPAVYHVTAHHAIILLHYCIHNWVHTAYACQWRSSNLRATFMCLELDAPLAQTRLQPITTPLPYLESNDGVHGDMLWPPWFQLVLCCSAASLLSTTLAQQV